MATITSNMTLEDFRQRYSSSKRPYEYILGKAVEKPVPTWLHAVLQLIIGEALRTAGYKAGSELDLRMDPEFEPRPDLVATRRSIATDYPSESGDIEIVVEILSPTDSMSHLLAKCSEYVRIGITHVFLADPESETAWQWNVERRQLDRTDEWLLTNGNKIMLDTIWQQLRERR